MFSKYTYLTIACFVIWLIPFVIRLIIGGDVMETASENAATNSTINRIGESLSANDNFEAFKLIFVNNSKGFLINIFGGFFFSLGTMINLVFNGFFSADVFVASYYNGLSLNMIVKSTLPHSIELLGFWLSGAVGFDITWNLVKSIKHGIFPSVRFYLNILYFIMAIALIMLVAAFIEAYISINIT